MLLLSGIMLGDMYMRSPNPGEDALLLFDARGADRGRVLGAGHYPSLAGARDVALLQELERSGDEPFVTTLRVRDGREPARDEQAWVTGCARSCRRCRMRSPAPARRSQSTGQVKIDRAAVAGPGARVRPVHRAVGQCGWTARR